MTDSVDPQWYRKIWSLDIRDTSWVERTAGEVDFIAAALELKGDERIADLACGFGRHALEFARRGHSVVGVDITPAYVQEASDQADRESLDARFICADLQEASFNERFDVVLNLADGAIGYFESDQENLKVFDLIASALTPGGKHLMGVCNAAYARKHFPRRHWETGQRSLALADFKWDRRQSRMLYTSYTLPYGQALAEPKGTASSIRLYDVEELRGIFLARGIAVREVYGDYNMAAAGQDDAFTLVVYSEKQTEQ